MKRAKKQAKKKPSRGPAEAAAVPERLYRPFEKLAKDGKKDKAKGREPEARGEARPRGGQEPEPVSVPAPSSSPNSAKGRSGAAVTGASGREAGREAASGGDSKARPGKPSNSKGAAGPGKTVAYASAAARAAAEQEQIHSRADAESFAVYMAGVRALEDKATRIPRSASRLERAAKGALPAVDTDAPARAELQALVAEGIRFETSDDGERIEGRRIEVEPREVRRLRRGQYTVDQQLDLHGMTTHDARKSLEAFVEKRRKEGDRVVRIIHGKGAHSPRGLSVLRGEIAAWLSQGPAKRHIAAFATAPPEEGGAGALLVLLMRRS
jgi:DNA-nicking Smr family endonuclease